MDNLIGPLFAGLLAGGVVFIIGRVRSRSIERRTGTVPARKSMRSQLPVLVPLLVLAAACVVAGSYLLR
jgi:hypothetical protein